VERQAAQALPGTSLFAAVAAVAAELVPVLWGLLAAQVAYRVVVGVGAVLAPPAATAVPVPVVNFVFGGLCNESTCN
jgi:hypothetical protein